MAQNGSPWLTRSPHPMPALAVFGGTFNPVHSGHLLMAETALQQFLLDQILWVPAYHPFYKSSSDLLSFEHRVEMLRRAIDPYPQFTLSTIEQTQSTPVYAIDTLLALQRLHSGCSWSWIIGLDAFQSLPRWYRHQDLAPRCRWLVAPRWQGSRQGLRTNIDTDMNTDMNTDMDTNTEIGAEKPGVPGLPPTVLCQQVADKLAHESIDLTWELLKVPRLEISSSLIRQYCRDRRSIRHLVPAPVSAYIDDHHLYQV